MNSRTGIGIGWIACVVLTACATATSALTLHVADLNVDLKKFLRDHPMAEGQSIRNDLIANSPTASVHIVQIRDAEKPHVHAEHDLRVVVVRGRGTIHIRDRTFRAGVGSVFEIEKGVPHFFVNGGPGPAAALVTFTPPFDGKDIVPVSP